MIHCIPVKNKYLMMIARGEKKVEVHLYSKSFRRIKPGDILLLFDSRANIVRAIVKDVRIYDSINDLVKNENIKEILPTANNADDLVKEMDKIYWMIGKNKLRGKKFIALELQVIDFIKGIDYSKRA